MTTLQPWALLLATIAAYRIARMLVLEEGPFSIFATVRGRVDPSQKSWIGRGMACIACVSFWVSLIVALMIGASVIEWLAMAGAIVIWREVMSR